MDIRKDYIAKARIYVEEEGNKIKRLKDLKEDYEILAKDIEGRKSKGGQGNTTSRDIRGIDSILVKREEELEKLRVDIETLESDKERFERRLNRLEKEPREVIEVRFINNERYNKPETRENTALKLHISESTVQKYEGWAFKEIAYIKYGEEARLK